MSSFYYLGVGVVSLAISIYNFEVSSKGNGVKTTDAAGLDASNIFPTIGLILAISYIIILVLSIFLSCVINALSNQLPEDYLNMGKCKRFFACFCKIFPPVLIILSWINFILIIVIWIMLVVNKDFKYTDEKTGTENTDYEGDVKVLNLVNSIAWILLHYGGAVVRDMTYQEPFMYSPDTGEPNCFRTLFLKKLGP